MSVLGGGVPTYGYDAVLRTPLPTGCQIIGYADDTLVLAREDSWRDAITTANHAVACVTRTIKRAGLKVAPEKTEATFYHDGTLGKPPETSQVIVEGIKVQIGGGVKYLGLFIDSTWRFREHFSRLTPNLEKAAAALSRILPNIGGPKGGVRRMYAVVVHSMALYGAPIWAQEMRVNREIKAMMHRAQRTMAIRAVRCYRTVSFRAATVLSKGFHLWNTSRQPINRFTEELKDFGNNLDRKTSLRKT